MNVKKHKHTYATLYFKILMIKARDMHLLNQLYTQV